MASGLLGKAAPAAATDTTLYIVPAGTVATLNVSVVNRGQLTAQVRIALGMTASPGPADYVEYDVNVPGLGGVLERTAIVAEAGERVIVRCSTADCSVRVHGFEEVA